MQSRFLSKKWMLVLLAVTSTLLLVQSLQFVHSGLNANKPRDIRSEHYRGLSPGGINQDTPVRSTETSAAEDGVRNSIRSSLKYRNVTAYKGHENVSTLENHKTDKGKTLSFDNNHKKDNFLTNSAMDEWMSLQHGKSQTHKSHEDDAVVGENNMRYGVKTVSIGSGSDKKNPVTDLLMNEPTPLQQGMFQANKGHDDVSTHDSHKSGGAKTLSFDYDNSETATKDSVTKERVSLQYRKSPIDKSKEDTRSEIYGNRSGDPRVSKERRLTQSSQLTQVLSREPPDIEIAGNRRVSIHKPQNVALEGQHHNNKSLLIDSENLETRPNSVKMDRDTDKPKLLSQKDSSKTGGSGNTNAPLSEALNNRGRSNVAEHPGGKTSPSVNERKDVSIKSDHSALRPGLKAENSIAEARDIKMPKSRNKNSIRISSLNQHGEVPNSAENRYKRKENILNITRQDKVKDSYSNVTGLQKKMGMFQTDPIMCRESPVVLCPRSTMPNSRHKSANSGHILREETQTGTINNLVGIRDNTARLDRPIKISIVNLPMWLNNKFLHVQQTRNGTCLFDDRPITSETQIVGVIGPKLQEEHKPSQRWPGQIYILMGWETPDHFDSSFTDEVSSVWDDQFNATMGYREDSDIFNPYATLTFSPKSPSQLPNYFEMSAKKTRQVVWFVSHCRTHSKREQYVEEMMKYIDVDIFGKCGRSTSCPRTVDLECEENLILDYRFHLSFENSFCPDYVTEKLFKVFSNNKHIVPVVRGGAEYKLWLPENTYIDAADFASPKDLAMFLLNMDTETYSRYLANKDLYKMDIAIDHVFENLCDAFTLPDRKVSFRPNVKQWLLDYTCYEPHDVPRVDWILIVLLVCFWMVALLHRTTRIGFQISRLFKGR